MHPARALQIAVLLVAEADLAGFAEQEQNDLVVVAEGGTYRVFHDEYIYPRQDRTATISTLVKILTK